MQTAPAAAHSLVKLNANAKDPLNKHACELSARPRNSCKRHHKIIISRRCKDASCRRSCPYTCKTNANQCKCKGPNEPTDLNPNHNFSAALQYTTSIHNGSTLTPYTKPAHDPAKYNINVTNHGKTMRQPRGHIPSWDEAGQMLLWQGG